MKHNFPGGPTLNNHQHTFDVRPFYVSTTGEEEIDTLQDHTDGFRVIWLQKGTGNFCIDLQQYSFTHSQVFFVKPGQVYACQAAATTEGYLISFAESFFNMDDPEFDATWHSSLFQLFANTQGIAVNTELAGDIRDVIERMVKEFNNNDLFRVEILKRYLKIFLIYLIRQLEGSFQTTRQTRNMELVQKFMSLLEKNFKTQKMVADYADLLCVTPNYLNEIIKKTTGYSASYHIRQRVVLEAKRRATYSDSCMKEIAYYLGFCDIAHFSKFFKNTAGVNFTEFKKEKMVFSAIPIA